MTRVPANAAAAPVSVNGKIPITTSSEEARQLYIQGRDLSEKLRHWLPNIGHIQIAGVPGRHEPDVGEINYRHIFALLDELNYHGWVGCEYRPLGSTSAGLGWMKTLRSPG